VIVFHRLTKEDLRQITDIQFGGFEGRLADRRIELELSDEAADWLTENGYDAVYGARPLKRLLQTAIADPLSLAILDGTFRDGDSIEVIVDGDALGFRKA